MKNKTNQKDIDSILGVDSIRPNINLSRDEQKKRLREAQNAKRGHPRKGETREALRQINVSCPAKVCEDFDHISLSSGKTKRALLEEAIRHLSRKYGPR